LYSVTNCQLVRIPDSYQRSVRPNAGAGPTNVTVNVYVRDAVLNEKTQILETTLTYRMNWKDSRLSYSDAEHPFKSGGGELADEIWIPDIFFGTEKSSFFHNVLFKNILVRVYPTGEILYSIRVSVNSLCKLHYGRFPFDQQTCNLTSESYGWTATDLSLSWKEIDPVQRKSDDLGNYRITDLQTSRADINTSTGTYCKLVMQFTAKHIATPFIYRFFLPAAVFTALSWIAFYLNPQDISVRVLLGFLGLASPYILNVSGDFFVPQSSITSIDVWTLVSVTIGALALFESVVVNRLIRSAYSRFGEDKPLVVSDNATVTLATRLDIYSRIGFPVLYTVFVIIFLSSYMN